MAFDLIRRVENLGSPRLLVVGDLILDRYIWGDAERISQEAPVPLLRADKREHRLGGVGRAAGATVGDLNEIAAAAASAGRVSVAAARDMEEAFLRTGRIGVSSFVDLIAVARNYAATTGEDVDAAVKELAAAFADPGKGADALNAKVGFLDDRTRQYVKTLAAQNDFTGAQRALLEALKGSLVDASETTTALGRAWDFVKRNASNALDSIVAVCAPSVHAMSRTCSGRSISRHGRSPTSALTRTAPSGVIASPSRTSASRMMTSPRNIAVRSVRGVW